MKTLLAFIASVVALFTPRTAAQKYMIQARAMMAVARADKAAGYPHAAKAAVQAALSYRAAYHAYNFYQAR